MNWTAKIFLMLCCGFLAGTVSAQSNELTTVKDFEAYSGKPLANKYGSASAVKVLYDLKSDKLFFIDANKYKNHFKFAEAQLKYIDGMGNFFKWNYSESKKRKYLLGNLNYFQAIDTYVIDVSPVDLMSVDQLLKLVAAVSEHSFVSKNVRFLVNNPRLQGLEEKIKASVKIISPSDIYGGMSFQAVSKYSNVGNLRVIENLKKAGSYKPTDILVLKEIPNYLPAVAGVIVTEFQTPLSHISILGLNRKIPICAYTKAFDNDDITKYDGQQVKLTVQADTFLIAADTSKMVTEQREEIKLKMDLSVDSLVGVEHLRASSATYVGSKAANFGELSFISQSADFKTPEGGFAIPFYFYKEHMKKAKVDVLIEKLLDNQPYSAKKNQRLLRRIRRKIMKTKIDKSLLQAIEAKVKANGKYPKVRFRSSTNAEDIKGFSGAGLYASKSGKLGAKKKTFERALQTVWASVWYYQAFAERQYYRIDQKNLAMGVMVHRSFPKEKVNGVAITKNIYRRNSNGFLVNAQLGNENVVDPAKGVTCDQFLCFPSKSNKMYADKIVIDVLTYSSLNDGNLVMTAEEIQKLANQLDVIKKHLAGDVDKWTYTRIGYDVEFKLDGKKRVLYIKQVRPYND